MKTITICGSVSFQKEIELAKEQLEELGFEVFIPLFRGIENFNLNNVITEESGERKIQLDLINEHYQKILKSHAILVLNYDKKGIKNYIGGNTFLELGFAFVNKREIFLINPIPEISYSSEIIGMQPKVIQNFEEINEYFGNLPKVFLASESEIKLRATDFAFRSINQRVNVLGIKTTSNVSEQPIGFEETYQGALNRLEDLKFKVSTDYEYLISIESGNIEFTKKFGFFDFAICLVENKNGERKIGLEASFPIPKEMTDLVPSVYPDLGILIQQKYGAKEKDPMSYISNGKIKRDELIQSAVKSAISQFN